MSRTVKINKEMIISSSYEFARKNGIEEFNARNIAKYIKCSTQPIYSCFTSIDELKQVVKAKALDKYHEYILEGLKDKKPFKGSGLAYIKFAREESNLFKLIFMDKINNKYDDVEIDDKPHVDNQSELIAKTMGISIEDASYIQLQSRIFVHGIASMIVSKTVEFDDEIISRLLNDYYFGIFEGIKRKKENL